MFSLVTFICILALSAGQKSSNKGQNNNNNNQDFQEFASNGPVQCTSKRDFLPDPHQCDKYYECAQNGPEERLCPDGLVFDDTRHGSERCDYPFNVDCGNRLELQPPTSGSFECPRMNGIFAHEDPSVCNVFYLCVGGIHQTYNCDGELHFNEYTGVCEWSNVAGRTGCLTKPNVLADGFFCPENSTLELNGVSIIHPLYAHPQDCQKFYICLNGKEPRENSCPDLSVFNDLNMKCDDPENVPGCENWFAAETAPASNSNKKSNNRRR